MNKGSYECFTFGIAVLYSCVVCKIMVFNRWVGVLVFQTGMLRFIFKDILWGCFMGDFPQQLNIWADNPKIAGLNLNRDPHQCALKLDA